MILYKRSVNFLFSILFLIFAENIDLVERLFGVLAINAGYFMFYYMVGTLMLIRVKALQRTNKKRIFSIQKRFAELFAESTKILAILIFIFIIFKAFITENYSLFIAAFLPVGIYFGGMRLKNGLREIK